VDERCRMRDFDPPLVTLYVLFLYAFSAQLLSPWFSGMGISAACRSDRSHYLSCSPGLIRSLQNISSHSTIIPRSVHSPRIPLVLVEREHNGNRTRSKSESHEGT